MAAQYDTRVLGKLPINPELAKACDNGVIELFEGDWLEEAANQIEQSVSE